MAKDLEALMTPKEAARVIGISPRHLTNLRARGLITGRLVGLGMQRHHRMYAPADIRAYLERVAEPAMAGR